MNDDSLANILQNAGLSDKETEVYSLLLKAGRTPASQLLPQTKLKRTTVYSVLEDLAEKGIIEKDESEPIIHFIPKHPYALKEFLDTQVQQIKQQEKNLEAGLPRLINYYARNMDNPGVRYLEGLDGFKKLYQDLLETKQDLRIFTSALDRTDQKMAEVIDQNITKQHKLGIKTQSIVAQSAGHSKKSLARLNQLGVEIRIAQDQRLALPSQIIIYGQKVAITSLKNEILTTLIENEAIAESFRNIFDCVWDSSASAHQSAYAQLPEDSAKNSSKISANLEKTSASA